MSERLVHIAALRPTPTQGIFEACVETSDGRLLCVTFRRDKLQAKLAARCIWQMLGSPQDENVEVDGEEYP